MGVTVREKIKGSGEFWVFIRYASERLAQKVGSEEKANNVGLQ